MIYIRLYSNYILALSQPHILDICHIFIINSSFKRWEQELTEYPIKISCLLNKIFWKLLLKAIYISISPSVAQNYLWWKVPIFCILLLTASSDSFGLKIKVVEQIHAEPHVLEFLKSVKYKPSYGCLKFKSGFAILRSEIRENEFNKSSDFLHFAAHSFIWELWPKIKSFRRDPSGVTGFRIFKIRQVWAEKWLFEVHPKKKKYVWSSSKKEKKHNLQFTI